MRSVTVKEFFRTLHHRKPIRAITTTAMFLGLPFVGAYSYFFAVKRIQLEKSRLRLADSTASIRGLKIVQISDLHFGPTNAHHNHFERAIDMINLQNPDLVCLTGDYYQWDPDYLYGLPKMLSRIRTRLGIFSSLGNHDYGSCYPGITGNDPFDYRTIKSAFEQYGIRVLTNESVVLNYNGQPFNLVGLHDLWSGMFDPASVFSGVDSAQPTLVLSHNPDTATIVEHDFDLMLSGHSHGGQVTWPIIGALTMPMKNKHLHRGFHKLSDRKHLYVTRGLGHIFRMRLNSPPEVTVLEIT